MRAVVRALACAALLAATLVAQQPPAYEVASVKPNQNGAARQGLQVSPGRYTFTAYTLTSLIDVAFQRTAFDQRERLGGPDWIDKDRFDVAVQAPAGAALVGPDGFPSGLFAMVRAVLADRFGLVTHNETRERPVYALTVARANRPLGDGLKRVKSDCAEGMRRMVAPGPGAPPPGPPPCSFGGGPGRITGNIVSLAMLSAILGRTVGRPVVDRTGIEGYFNVTLEFAPEAGIAGPLPPEAPRPDASARADAPSIFTAVQEQLGLKLEATRAPVDVLVIDRATQPSEN